ncbi:MAG: polysulfide reductase NrfD [Alphaproteobacteria bacterium]|nr:polysulfide reductase NrfD [Alphaproteobacteria bacterium]
MDATMSYQTQDIWTTWFAVYLYLGGLGAATLALAIMTNMYIKPHKEIVLWGVLSGVAMLAGGSALLFIHLLNHIAAWHVLVPTAVFNKPDAWIAWGVQFISGMMILGLLYALPTMVASEGLKRFPVVGAILKMGIVVGIANLVDHKLSKLLGWLAALCGLGTAVYTGLLLQSFPAVALWNNPGVPVLFTVSAFSTALAYLLLVLNVFVQRKEDHGLQSLYERLDLGLIVAEMIIIFSFYNYLRHSSESAMRSADMLFSNAGWIVGFIGFGLVVPFLIELRGLVSHWQSRTPIVLAAVLVLAGGFLLRHYFMFAGVYACPS